MSVSELPIVTVDINKLIPIGDPLYRVNPTLPSEYYGWMEGQEFDVLEYEELAKVYPSGVLPDPRYQFLKIVPRDEVSGLLVEQSVQPLSFIGNALPNHVHLMAILSGWAARGDGYGGGQMSRSIGSMGGVGWVNATKLLQASSAGTPSGRIGGTGIKTAPDHMQVYCMCRIK